MVCGVDVWLDLHQSGRHHQALLLGTTLLDRLLGNRSKLVTNGSLDQWRDACEHIAHLRWQVDQRPLSDTGDCHDHSHHDTSLLFVMATLPLLEHGLRRMYVDLNRCKPDREHALVGGDYYVTLDVILDALVPEQFFNDQHPAAETVDGKNGTRGQPNRLLSVLGPERVNICYDLFVSPHGPRLRDRVSHGEANHLLGTDITDRGWFHMYLGLVLSLLAYFPQNDIRPNENASARSSYDTLMASIDTWVAQYTVLGYDDFAFLKKDLLRSLWTLWTNSATVAAIAAAEERADSDMGDVTLVHPLFCQSLKEQAGAPRIALMFNKPVERGAIDDVLEEAVKAWHHPRPDNVFTQSLSGWSTLMQGIQQALEKTSAKFETFHEEEASGKISTRKWRQLAAMKDALPRLWGMMAACLALVEWLVIYQLDEDGASVEHASIQTHPILVIPPVRGGKGSEINGTVGAGGAEQQPQQQQQQQSMRSAEWAARVSKQEVQLRVKLMAFVDRFVISIERFSLEAVEQAWGSLRTQLAKILVEQYLAE
ncbi:hypothetical protein BGZ73_006287 [Actinomortierella ambigua]|nr:hypothetical protein BGZ73_006287 [Actinomortierella ambigua]